MNALDRWRCAAVAVVLLLLFGPLSREAISQEEGREPPPIVIQDEAESESPFADRERPERREGDQRDRRGREGRERAEETPREQAQPPEQQIRWVRENAIRLETVEAQSGFEDLAPLRELIGDARIVSLGESTHGSREIFQMKHRFVEFLASKMGFTIFSIEANMPEAYRLNDYVLNGNGDPKELIAGMYFWTWNTQEVLDMVKWMRRFNKQGKARIQFTGFDMQKPDVAMGIVLDFIAEHDADLLKKAKQAYATVARPSVPSVREFGVATGSFPVDEARGKHVTFSGWIKTENVQQGHAGLWWRADGPNGKVLAFDNMARTGPRGTTDWSRFTIALAVPKETVNINFGLLMPGEGKSWFDGLEVKLDGKTYRNAELFDFGFEAEEVKGLALVPRRTYRTRLDGQVSKVGKQSLRMESVEGAPREDAIPADEALKAAKQVLESLQQSRDELADKVGEGQTEQVDWAIQNGRLVVQCMEMRTGRGGNVRDRSMAENVAWILEQNPTAKIVLWAHNGHIAKRQHAMGKHLDEKFGDKHLAIAFATAKGNYQAIASGKGLSEHPLQEPPAGSVERVFRRAGVPIFILDLRKVDRDSDESGWLAMPMLFRRIGALAVEKQFGPENLYETFDAVIYIEETSRARRIQHEHKGS